MATITNLQCVDESGQSVPCDAFGNNVAFDCPGCGHPILAIVREHQHGSSPDKPAACRKCDFRGWVEVGESVLRLHRIR